MTKILVIEDEKIIGEMISMYLTDEAFSVYRVENGRAGLEAMQSYDPDVVLLDLMLPDMDGIELCEEVRRHSDTPIIVISMNTQVNERVRALNAGADDYLCKPFSMQELKARIGAAVRRYKPAAVASAGTAGSGGGRDDARWLGGSGVELDPQKRLVLVNGKPVDTTFSEFELLKLLFEHPGRVFTRDELISALRGIDSYVNDRAIDVHITNLRKKIEAHPKEPKYIKTVWGVGYKLALD